MMILSQPSREISLLSMDKGGSANLSRLMSELCSFKCLKLYSLNFAIAHAQIKIVMLIKIGHNCVA